MPVENNDVILERRKTMQVNKSLLKKIVGLLSVLCLAVVMAFGLVACGGKTIASTTINAQGHLIVTYSDNTTEDLGLVVGQNGVDNVGLKDGCTHVFAEHTVKYANCSEEGIVLKVCTLCKGQVIGTTAKDATVHGSYEVVVAEVAGVKVPTLVYESFETKGGDYKAATCTEDGYNQTVCGGCGKELANEPIAKFEHKRPNGSSAYVSVTGGVLDGNICVNGTFDGDVCTLCNDVQNAKYYAPENGGHHTTTADWKVVAAPTKDAAGEIKGICSVCETEQTIELPKLTASVYTHSVPTCQTVATEDQEVYAISNFMGEFDAEFKFDVEIGHKVGTTSFVEGDTYEYEDIKALVTSGDISWSAGNPGSCKETKYATYQCADCTEKIVIIAKGDHKYEDVKSEGVTVMHDATCDTAAYYEQICSVCQDKKTITVGDPNGHTWVKVSEAPGSAANTLIINVECDVCGETDTVDATYVSTVGATCSAAKTVKYSYLLNGETKYIDITEGEKSGHKATLSGTTYEFIEGALTAYEYDVIDALVEAGLISWSAGNPGDCTEEKFAILNECGDCKEQIVFKAKGTHVWKDVVDEDDERVMHDASCTKAAYYEQVCEKCNEKKEIPVGEANGHTYEKISETAGEGTALIINAKCKVCGDEITVNAEFVKENEATCEAPASKEYTYVLNGDTYPLTIVEGTVSAHKTLGGLEILEGATYEYEDIKDYLAEITWSAGAPGNCKEAKYAIIKCDMCKNDIVFSSKGTHTYIAEPDKDAQGNVIKAEPTCTEEGYNAIYTCTACGEYKKVNEADKVEATGHDWEAEVVEGTVKLTCATCGATATGIIDSIDDETYAPRCGVEGKVIYYYYETEADKTAQTNLKSAEVKADALDHDFTNANEIEFKLTIGDTEHDCKAKECQNCGKYFIFQPPVDELA